MHFDEKSMFAGDKKGAKSLKVKLVFWMTSKIPVFELSCVTLENLSTYQKRTAESRKGRDEKLRGYIWGLLIYFIVNEHEVCIVNEQAAVQIGTHYTSTAELWLSSKGLVWYLITLLIHISVVVWNFISIRKVPVVYQPR